MRLYYRVLLSSLVAGLSASAIASELPARNDYAYGFGMETHGDSEFFGAPVPIAVYQSVTDSRMRDAGVYNADGQPVPRIFEQPEVKNNDIERELELSLIALYGEQATQPEQLRILLHQTDDGTTLEVNDAKHTGVAAVGQADDFPLAAYIVDTRNLDQDIKTLEFTWPPQSKGMIGRVRVEDSNDLQNWRKVGSATLAELRVEDTSIEQRRVELSRDVRDYLRITWQSMPDTWRLDDVTGIYAEKGTPAERDWITLEAVVDENTEREYLFNAGGFPPVDRVSVLLPDENIVVRASIFYRLNGQAGWRLSHDAIFYNITRQDNTLQSSPVTVDIQRAAEWKVRIDSGVSTGPLRLKLGWRPDHLIFLAQGTPPFELLAGRAKDKLDNYPQQRMLGDSAIFKMLRDTGREGIATLGDRYTVAGQQSLEIPAKSIWKTLLLWAGLSGAIGLVGWLVFSLSREMRQD